MAFKLRVFENSIAKDLLFATREDAKNFKKVVNCYMEESGAGNGYGTYWVLFDAEIVETGFNNETVEFNMDYLRYMIGEIVRIRTAGADCSLPEITTRTGGPMRFSVGKLPPRQRPTVGDMYRSLISKGAPRRFEGRVIGDDGETLEVINAFDEEKDGSIKSNAKKFTVPAAQVMKINDWLAEHRAARARC